MKVLVVEDDAVVSQMIASILHRNGYEITLASDGNEAIKKMRTCEFDLMITDILMPEKEGIEIIQEVRGNSPELKIIAISSGGETGYAPVLKIAESFGADASLSKPFTPEELLGTIRHVTQ